MKGVVDLFIAKDRIAIFWFLTACGVIVVAAWYLDRTIRAVHNQPQFVIMDSAGVYYIAPTGDFENAIDLHAAQTRLAMETLFNRGPKGLDSPKRLSKIFGRDAVEYILEEMKAESATFRDQDIHQKVEIDRTEVLKTVGEGALTSATSQIIRVGVFKGKTFNEVYDVKARFSWVLNKDMRNNGQRRCVSSCGLNSQNGHHHDLSYPGYSDFVAHRVLNDS